MVRSKMNAWEVFIQNLKQGLKMIFTRHRHCKNCGNSYLKPASIIRICLFHKSEMVEDEKSCGDWRPSW